MNNKCHSYKVTVILYLLYLSSVSVTNCELTNYTLCKKEMIVSQVITLGSYRQRHIPAEGRVDGGSFI